MGRLHGGESGEDMKGRKPKPTRLKVISGNPGKRPINDSEPDPDKIGRAHV